MSPLFAGCSYDDTAINARMDDFESRLKKIETQVSQMNENISSFLKTVTALEAGDRIISVNPLEDGSGYTIDFSKTGSIVIYNGKDGEDGDDGKPGQNGHSPVIGVKQDSDGIYYWTVDEEYLLDKDGNKIAATAHISTPRVQLSADGQHYEISFDNGTTWLIVGDVAGTSGPTIFDNVVDGNESVTFYLTGGGTIVIPKVQQFALVIEDLSYSIKASEMKFIPYSLTNPDNNTIVDGFATDGYSIEIQTINNNSGNIEVTAPNPIVDGKAFIFAINENGVTSAKVLRFEGGLISIDETGIPELVPAEGGDISIPITTNLSYGVVIAPEAQSWMSYSIITITKALRNEELVLKIEKNTSSDARSGDIVILDSSTNEMIKYITIVQSGSGSANEPDGITIGDWENDGTIKL